MKWDQRKLFFSVCLCNLRPLTLIVYKFSWLDEAKQALTFFIIALKYFFLHAKLNNFSLKKTCLLHHQVFKKENSTNAQPLMGTVECYIFNVYNSFISRLKEWYSSIPNIKQQKGKRIQDREVDMLALRVKSLLMRTLEECMTRTLNWNWMDALHMKASTLLLFWLFL